ncbi:MAG: ATP synthase F1 subunit epsilon [Pseudomonadota bacterium]
MAEFLTNKTFRFELVSPERIVVSGDAAMVLVPGKTGDFGVLAGHAPLSSSIRPGIVSVHLPSGEVRKIFVAGGFADVSGEFCSVLAEDAVDVNDLNRAETENTLKALQADLDTAEDDAVTLTKLRRQIVIAEAKIAACAQISSGLKVKNSVGAGAGHA